MKKLEQVKFQITDFPKDVQRTIATLPKYIGEAIAQGIEANSVYAAPKEKERKRWKLIVSKLELLWRIPKVIR